MRYMEGVMERCRKDPGKIFLIDAAEDKTLSYGELDELTSKVYAYLSDKGIGKEDFVMIDLPRGISPVVTAIGVWRSGAAYVIVEEETPAEKKDFIYNDCGCCLHIDSKVYSKILESPVKGGYAENELHDACYAIYTSGTTGNPKGVIHEYGTLEDNLSHFKYDGEYLFNEDDRMLLLSPLSFVVGSEAINLLSYLGTVLILAPFSVARDKDKLSSCMAKYRITTTFFTPTLLRLDPVFNPEMRLLILSSEPVKDYYRDDVTIVNVYAQSESGYLVTIFKLERAYDLTPIGKPQCPGREIFIMDEDCKRVPDGEAGEICFENPYFRGYMNLPQENTRAFMGGIYHSGDIGKMLPDGNVVLLGRSDDMVKVNGNRVEPGEIETAMKEVLNLSWAAAKAFVDGERVSICGYYTDDISLDHLEAKHKLGSKLPAYMVPTHFIKLSDIPMNSNGKLSRKDLPKPDMAARYAPYIEPQNDIEKCLCEAAEKILNISKVGALDDLYELGLDSLSTIRFLSLTKLDGLTVGMIFRGLTPREIANIYQTEAFKDEKRIIEEGEYESRKREHPLLKSQLASFDWQLNAPHSTMNNLACFFRLGRDVDIPRVATALENVLRAHGVFSTILSFNEDGEIVQKYDQEINKKVVVEKVTEAELVDIREHLITYYKLIGNPLYRVRLFETENGGYLFIDMHHIISDGASGDIFFKDLIDSYEGKTLEEDQYYANLSRLENEAATEIYAKAKEYYTTREAEHTWSKHPKLDGKPVVRGLGQLSFLLPVHDEGFAKLMEHYSVGKNGFMVASSVLTLAAYNDVRYISLQWTYNGRESAIENNIMGMLIRDITFYIELKKGMTVESFLREVREQMMQGLSYSCYPHTNLIKEPNMSLCIIYQSDFISENKNNEVSYYEEELPNPFNTNENLMDMEIYDVEEGTEIVLTYLPSCYKDESIQRFRHMIMKSAALLAQYAEEPWKEIDQIVSEIKDR